jgi:hypothetical protein
MFLRIVCWLYRITRRYIPEDRSLHSHRCENPKSFTASGICSSCHPYRRGVPYLLPVPRWRSSLTTKTTFLSLSQYIPGRGTHLRVNVASQLKRSADEKARLYKIQRTQNTDFTLVLPAWGVDLRWGSWQYICSLFVVSAVIRLWAHSLTIGGIRLGRCMYFILHKIFTIAFQHYPGLQICIQKPYKVAVQPYIVTPCKKRVNEPSTRSLFSDRPFKTCGNLMMTDRGSDAVVPVALEDSTGIYRLR